MIVPGIPFVQGRNVYKDIDGRKYGIAIHNTSNTATDEGEASYATRRSDTVSAHFYADADSVTQSLDTAAKAGHAGSTQGNENAIAVEITGDNNKSRDWWLKNVKWDLLGKVLAQVIRAEMPGFQVRRASVAEMKANPKVPAFYAHDDMRLAWGGTTHDDPGPNFPWDALFQAVNAALGSTGQEDDMQQYFIGHDGATDTYWLCDGMFARGPLVRPPAGDEIADIKQLAKEGMFTLWKGGEVREGMVAAFGLKIPWGGAGSADIAAVATATADELAQRLAG